MTFKKETTQASINKKGKKKKNIPLSLQIKSFSSLKQLNARVTTSIFTIKLEN